MDSKELVNDLIRFGLFSRQAETYLFLLENGPKTAGQISEGTGGNRSDIYRILNELLECDLIEKNLASDRKTLFIPTSPKEAIQRLLTTKMKEIDELSKIMDEITKQLESIKQKPKEKIESKKTSKMLLRVIGETCAYDTLKKMLRNAKQEIDITINSRSLSLWFAKGIDELLKDAAKREVKVRIITNIKKEKFNELNTYNIFCKIKYTENTISTSCIIDGKEILMGALTKDILDNDRYDAYLATSEQGLVETLKTFFERTWETAIDTKEKLQTKT